VTNPEVGLDTLDIIAELVDQSLVQALGEAAEPRFGMLETIREFAVEQLEASGTADEYRARHQTYYLELAERGNTALSTAGQVEWLNRLGRTRRPSSPGRTSGWAAPRLAAILRSRRCWSPGVLETCIS
jgi:hypothetical protein